MKFVEKCKYFSGTIYFEWINSSINSFIVKKWSAQFLLESKPKPPIFFFTVMMTYMRYEKHDLFSGCVNDR